jgi:3-keto-5-aminohexanoate cleavage enzyme
MGDHDNKRIITVATTGAWPTKENNPGVPLQPAEIAEDIYACWREGAAICHIHVRDDDARPSMAFEKFQETVRLIRTHEDCDIVMNLTTSGGINLREEDRIRPFHDLLPEMATFDCGSMNWQHSAVFENHPRFLERLGTLMQEVDVKPEIEAFDPGMLYNAGYYLKRGVLKAPLHFQFCMGVPGGIKASTKNLVFMKDVMDEVAPGSTWSSFGVGAGSMEILYAGVAMGGHIRVGMEDNVLYRKGQLATSNAQFVARAKRVLEEFGCEAATCTEARQILNLRSHR